MNASPHTLDALNTLSHATDYDPDSMSVDKARVFIRQCLAPVCSIERVHLREALGRVLAENIVSKIAVPGFDNAAMDGYALRFADVTPGKETRLQRIGVSFAGHPFDGEVGAGQCLRIFTGAVMPRGADTVVMQEHTREENGVAILAPDAVTSEGQNRRFAGEDIAPGATVFTCGQRLHAAELGMLASLGVGEVSVYRKLRVAFFSTGDELISLGTPPTAGKIYDSNRYALYGMLQQLGVETMDLGVVADQPEALEAALLSAADTADVVITTGGVSVGEADFIKAMLERLGKVLFWKIAMKPGRPLAYGMIGDAHFFGLPGNPVSAMAVFYQFVREALLILQGQALVTPPPTFRATLTAPVKKAPGRTEFQRGTCEIKDGQCVVTPIPAQGSHILSSMSRANCFIVLPMDSGSQPVGAVVDVQPFHGLMTE
ncbi:MAG: molybdopterin molybdotransferase MoeA [Proteobacteria bacterium]|nr:molybdopterin molybdotransferase MoeA [Pseudomonadota bacterium]MCL2306903.1 molybdopterin molybdotransferase MoeA [Pseudomonadota bacterium]